MGIIHNHLNKEDQVRWRTYFRPGLTLFGVCGLLGVLYVQLIGRGVL